MITTLLVAISIVLSLVGIIPYIIDTLKGKTKPRIVTWIAWGSLCVVSAAASLADQQYPAGILSVISALEIFTIVAIGYRRGDKSFATLDIVCMIGVILGLVAWWLTGSGSLAIILVIIVDFIGSIPTFVHSWVKPHEETLITYVASMFACLASIIAAGSWKITAIAYASYSFIACAIFVIIIVHRKKRMPVKNKNR